MKKLLTLVLIGAFLISALPSISFAYYPPPKEPEFVTKINGEWTSATAAVPPGPGPYIFEGVSYCTTFEVEILVMDVVDLYAYTFTVAWDTTYFSLTSHEVKHIHTSDLVIEDDVDPVAGTYTQTVTAINPALGFNGTAPIANLFFHIDNDVQWPDQMEFEFVLTGDYRTSCTTIVEPSHQGGFVKLVPLQPTIKMLPPVVYKSVVGETFEVQFEIQNVVRMKSFHFLVTWDPTQLTIDAQNVWVKDFLPPPYELVWIGPFDVPGEMYIDVVMPCTKPPRNGTGELFGMRFTTLNPWDDGDPDTVDIPPYYYDQDAHTWFPGVCWNYINIAGFIDKVSATGDYEEQILGDPAGVTVKAPNVDPTNPPSYKIDPTKGKYVYDIPCAMGGFIIGYYEFRPIPGDLDMDGHCDVIDLSAIAAQYGKPDTGFDLDGSGFVDLTDVVIVAKNVCRTAPDPLFPWPILDP